MAAPIIPLVLLGVGILALRSQRRRTTKKTSDSSEEPTIRTVVFVPPRSEEPSGEPSEPRDPGLSCEAEDGAAAWDDQGHCKTFWIDGTTDQAIEALLLEQWEARGRPTFSELCLAIPDPTGGEFAPPKDSPMFVEIVAAALQGYYGIGAVFPPVEPRGSDDPRSPFWVQETWQRATAIARGTLCEM